MTNPVRLSATNVHSKNGRSVCLHTPFSAAILVLAAANDFLVADISNNCDRGYTAAPATEARKAWIKRCPRIFGNLFDAAGDKECVFEPSEHLADGAQGDLRRYRRGLNHFYTAVIGTAAYGCASASLSSARAV